MTRQKMAIALLLSVLVTGTAADDEDLFAILSQGTEDADTCQAAIKEVSGRYPQEAPGLFDSLQGKFEEDRYLPTNPDTRADENGTQTVNLAPRVRGRKKIGQG